MIITCESISKSYKSGFLQKTKKKVLKEVSFRVNQNEVFGIIGLNGAGKSSLIKILMGFVHPDGGFFSIGGINKKSATDIIPIGYLPENPSLYSALTLEEHLHFACNISKKDLSQKKSIIDDIINQVGLSHASQIPIRKFSKGMTQRAALAYAMIREPEILILDEPMSGLDPLGRKLVIDLITNFRAKGMTILFCSHILTDVERICDRIGIMHNGHLLNIIAPPLETGKSNDRLPVKGEQTPLETVFLDTVNNVE